MGNKYTYINRDLSWLQFNYRVLQEGMDPKLPLYDRIKFLAIYSSNLDEFFRVRVANLLGIAKLDKPKLTKKLHIDPNQLLEEIQTLLNKQLDEYGLYLRNTISSDLEKSGILLYNNKPIAPVYFDTINHYFKSRVAAYIQPVLIDDNGESKYMLKNKGLYLALRLKSTDGNLKLAYVNIPSDEISRFYHISLKNSRHAYILLDDIVSLHLSDIFPGYEILESKSIKLSRDADLNIGDEYSGNLVEKIKKQLDKRNIGAPARFLYDGSISEELLNGLKATFQLKKEECVEGGRYHNLNDLMDLPNPLKPNLQDNFLPRLKKRQFVEANNIFDLLRKNDVLFHFPYYNFNHVLRLFNEAAIDPNVEKIKVTFYRLAKKSIIANALISASKNGKSVIVFMEVKARFDEENNLFWARKMEEAGIKIVYSMPGLKVHAKVALFKRRLENGKTENYAYLGTGNLNEDTAKIYTDHGLMTSHPEMTKELDTLFKYLHEQKPIEEFNHLLVSRFNMKNRFIELIDREIEHAKNGKDATILLKINNIEHRDMIDKLYEANNAGVRITLIVRGICCIKPNVIGQSENMHIVRLVDRFLEHSRIFVFHNGGEEEIYLGSADWMTRNFEHRIEVIFPIYDLELKKEINEYIKFQLRDNQKLVVLNEDHDHSKANQSEKREFRAQMDIYEWLKDKESALKVSENEGNNKGRNGNNKSEHKDGVSNPQ